MRFHARDMDLPFASGGSSGHAGIPPVSLRVFSVLQQIFSIILLTYCIHSRWPTWKTIKTQPFISWINVILYIDSLLFTMAQMITRYAFGLNANFQTCQSAVMFCLTFYLSTKLLIYFYFTERSFLVWRRRSQRRSRNFYYIFNMTVIIGGYLAVIIATYMFRINDFSLDGQCIIGIQRKAGIPLATYETCINLYLTFLFLFPLRKVYGYKNQNSGRLRRMAVRCMIGTSITTLSTGVNLAVVVALKGEQAWLCLMLCNLDVVVCVFVLHWITSYGKSPTSETRPTQGIGMWNTDRTATQRTAGARGELRNSSWKDPMVTTSISYDNRPFLADPASPNGISVLREHSRMVETLETQDAEGPVAVSASQWTMPSPKHGAPLETSLDSNKSSNLCATDDTEEKETQRHKNLARLSLPDVRKRDFFSPAHVKELKTTLTPNETSSSRNPLSRTASVMSVFKEGES